MPSLRRSGRETPEGPRARFTQLLPFILEHKKTLVAVAILSLIGAGASLAQPLLVGQLIERVQQSIPLGSLVWFLVALVIASSIIDGFQHYLLQRAGTAVVYSSRRKLIARILRLPISEFDARRTGDLVSRVGTDTTLLYAVLTQGLADLLGSALVFVGALIAMLVIDPVLLGIIVVVLALAVLAVVAFSGRLRRATAEQQEKVGELSSSTERAISSIRTIRAADATERETEAVTEKATEAYGLGVRIAKISALVVPISGIAMQVSLLVVLGVGGLRVASGAISIAQLVTFIMFLFMMIMPLGQAFGAVMSVNQALGALGRIQEILDLPTETENDAAIAADVQAQSATEQQSDAAALTFRDVRFTYPESVVKARAAAAEEARGVLENAHLAPLAAPTAEAHEVLSGVTFDVKRGSRTALVGPSGAGKSTIFTLIERFYDPTAGSISLDGRDIRCIDRDELRRNFGYVEQDAPTLAGTLAENLRLASPDAADADCERVLRAVNLGAVLDRSPAGLETEVGENGVMLSGGERQRLAIARALLSDAPILLLDESTSALDGANENLMREAIAQAATGRTLLVIAHRLSTVIDSDQIVVLDEGEVLGVGTHDELVERVPLYRDLARHQLLAS